MMDKIFCNLCRFKRRGASLVNVCVFFLAATMITAQVFFFSTTTTETLAEEAKSVERRFSIGQKLELAFDELRKDTIESKDISPDKISFYSTEGYKIFYPATIAWSDDVKGIYIYNLNYTLGKKNYAVGSSVACNWDEAAKTPHKLIFPPMPPDSNGHYFLVRVTAPGQGIGKKLMYQVLTRRWVYDNSSSEHRYEIKPLTFQEVWYE